MKPHNRPVRVLIVDDSAFMRRVIQDLLRTDPLIDVVGHARNGKEAIAMVHSEKPDVVTMDVEMPVMDGLEALKTLMAENSLPVIMLSSLTEKGSAETIRALELGAVDFIQKPALTFMVNSEGFRNELITKIKASVFYRVQPRNQEAEKTITTEKSAAIHPKDKVGTTGASEEAPKEALFEPTKTIVAIAISTGGPKALQSVIPRLPANFPSPILVVQHMPPGFTRSLADRLNHISAISVKEAENEEPIKQGVVYIAPGDFHMRVRHHMHQQYIILDQDSPIGGHRPAADALFHSLSSSVYKYALCVVMTGMGSDGTNGVRALREKKAIHVVTQDESSCVVYGMPKSIVLSGLANDVMPLDKISSFLVNKLGG